MGVNCRTPSGVRGLKCRRFGGSCLSSGRTPSGVRGLKCSGSRELLRQVESHPVRGAWIEIKSRQQGQRRAQVAPRQGCVD